MLGHSIDSNQYFYFLEGIDFLFTTAHELGHSFGLAHSDHRDSIMAPIYRSSISEHYQMAYDDIIAIQVSAQPSTRHSSNRFHDFYPQPEVWLGLALKGLEKSHWW